MNLIAIAGRIGREPEQDVVKDGIERVRFSVAVNRFAKKGEEPVTDWFDCVAFGKQGAAIKEYFNKGDQIMIKGAMQSYKGTKDPSKTYWNVLVESFDFGAKKNGKTESEPVPGVTEDSSIPF